MMKETTGMIILIGVDVIGGMVVNRTTMFIIILGLVEMLVMAINNITKMSEEMNIIMVDQIITIIIMNIIKAIKIRNILEDIIAPRVKIIIRVGGNNHIVINISLSKPGYGCVKYIYIQFLAKQLKIMIITFIIHL